jgi:hypothetical protein
MKRSYEFDTGVVKMPRIKSELTFNQNQQALNNYLPYEPDYDIRQQLSEYVNRGYLLELVREAIWMRPNDIQGYLDDANNEGYCPFVKDNQ